jgi:beta-phosphoglucomutase
LNFDSVLFDFDGVLIDSEPDHYAAWVEALQPVGIDLSWEFYEQNFIGLDDREVVRRLPGDFDTNWARYPVKKNLFRQRMQQPRFDPAWKPLLTELQGKYRLAVVSSSARAEVEPLLEYGGLRDFFATIVNGDDVERKKPAPDPYLLAAERLNAARPLAVEDSQSGVLSARAAGFHVLEIPKPAEAPELVRSYLLMLR